VSSRRDSGPPPERLATPLRAWYRRHARALPWRATCDPYRIWVSEVMLQQTRVATVLRHYDRFLRRFPDVGALAGASPEEVRAQWSGLGFYRRARHLHEAARLVVERHGGHVPRDPAELGALPGVGRYTLGAVLSAAFDARLPIVDGNVARVLTRVYRLPGDPRRGATQRALWRLAEALLPGRGAGETNQALMELGALVCLPRGPRCGACPLEQLCDARACGDPQRFPELERPREPLLVRRAALRLDSPDGRILLVQRPPEGLLASLWELPACDLAQGEEAAPAARRLARTHRADAPVQRVGAAEHRFSHRLWRVEVFRSRVGLRSRPEPAGRRWVLPTELGRLGVPTATRKILRASEDTEGQRGRSRPARSKARRPQAERVPPGSAAQDPHPASSSEGSRPPPGPPSGRASAVASAPTSTVGSELESGG